MRKFLCALALGGVLMTPITMRADDHDRDRDRDRHARRYYDPYQRDYHEWNEQEARAYRHWLEKERRAHYHDWQRASKREQREYWRWRHDHRDWR
jgi:hypothetical protein